MRCAQCGSGRIEVRHGAWFTPQMKLVEVDTDEVQGWYCNACETPGTGHPDYGDPNDSEPEGVGEIVPPEGLKTLIVAALSLWVDGDHPRTNPEYLRGQAETICRFMRAFGRDIPSDGLTDTLMKAATSVSRGWSTAKLADEVVNAIK